MNDRALGAAPTLARNLLLLGELLELSSALRSAGIEFVVLKGIPLAYRLFGRLDARSPIDNDLLVHRRDARRTRDLLAELGYVSLPWRVLERELDEEFQHPMVRRTPSGVTLLAEIHWDIVPGLYGPSPQTVVWSHVEPFPLRNQCFLVLDRIATTVHLASHFVQHAFCEPRILRDFARAWNLWAGSVDPEEFLRFAVRLGLADALAFAAVSAEDLGLLEAPVRLPLSTRVRWLRRLLPAQRFLAASPRTHHVRMALSLLLAPPRRIPRWVWRLTFPSVHRMSRIYERAPCPSLYARYLVRPFHPLFRIVAARLGMDPFAKPGPGSRA